MSRTTACGRWFTVRNIRPMYSPMRPSSTSCVPENIKQRGHQPAEAVARGRRCATTARRRRPDATIPAAPSVQARAPSRRAAAAREKFTHALSHRRTQPPQRVGALARPPRLVPHLDRSDPLRDLQHQAVDVRIRPRVVDDLLRDERADAAEAREIEAVRLVERPVGHPVGEPAADVAPGRVLLVRVVAEDDVEARFACACFQSRTASAGGFCPSSSRLTMCAPRAWRQPVSTALCSPKLRACSMSVIGHRRAMRRSARGRPRWCGRRCRR